MQLQYIPRAASIATGNVFPSKKELIDVLQTSFILQRRAFVLQKSDSTRYTVKCASVGCRWRLSAGSTETGQFTIRFVSNMHDPVCDLPENRPDTAGIAKMATADWVANRMQDALQKNPFIRPRQLRKDILNIYRIDISKDKVYKARSKAYIQSAEDAIKGCLPTDLVLLCNSARLSGATDVNETTMTSPAESDSEPLSVTPDVETIDPAVLQDSRHMQQQLDKDSSMRSETHSVAPGEMAEKVPDVSIEQAQPVPVQIAEPETLPASEPVVLPVMKRPKLQPEPQVAPTPSPKRKRKSMSKNTPIRSEIITTPGSRSRREKPEKVYKIAGYTIDHISEFRLEDGKPWFTVHWKDYDSTPQLEKDLLDAGCRPLVEAYHAAHS